LPLIKTLIMKQGRMVGIKFFGEAAYAHCR